MTQSLLPDLSRENLALVEAEKDNEEVWLVGGASLGDKESSLVELKIKPHPH